MMLGKPNARPFWWRPSELPEGCHVAAACLKATCHGYRYLPRAYLVEKAGDVPLDGVENRLRCVERPLANKRGSACGGAMALEWVHRPENDRSSLFF